MIDRRIQHLHEISILHGQNKERRGSMINETEQATEYPAFIYKKNGYFMADCIMHNLVSIGITENEAIENLERKMDEMNDAGHCFKFKYIKTIN